jgi:hypothetical protein
MITTMLYFDIADDKTNNSDNFESNNHVAKIQVIASLPTSNISTVSINKLIEMIPSEIDLPRYSLYVYL